MLTVEFLHECGLEKEVSKAELNKLAQTSKETSRALSVLSRVGERWKDFSEEARKDMILFAVTTMTLAGMVLSACSPIESTQIKETESVATEVSVIQTVEPTLFPQIEPTIIPINEPLKVSEIRIEQVEKLSDKQSEEYFRVEAEFQKLWNYVTGASESEIKTEEWGELVAYVMIDPGNEDSLAVGFERADTPGVLLTFPFGAEYTDDVFKQYSEDGTALVDFTYLDLKGVTTEGESYVLKWRNGQWVRVNDNEVIIEKLSGESIWEKEKRNVVISMDANNPTRVSWEDLFGTNTNYVNSVWNGFGNDMMEWKELPRWENSATQTLAANLMTGNSTLANNLEKVGFVSVTAPDGKDYFVIVQAVVGNDGRVGYWKFPVGLNTNPNILANMLDMKKVEMPMVAMSESILCPSWTTNLPCMYNEELFKSMETFLKTGIVTVEMEKYPLMTSGSY